MSVEPHERNKNRRFYNSRAPWIPYTGNCKEIDAYLSSKNSVGWLIPKFINSFLRGVSQVLFVNNPFSGLLILLGIFWCDILVGLAVIVSGTSAILTALLLKQHSSLISSGLTTYNAVLVGSVTASLWTPLYSEPLIFKIWAFIIFGSLVSVFLTSAFSNILSSYDISLPCLTLPFNIVVIVLFASLMPPPPAEMVMTMTMTSETPSSVSLGFNTTSEMTTAATMRLYITSIQPKNITPSIRSVSISLAAISSTSAPAAPSPVSPKSPYLFNRAARQISSELELRVPDPDSRHPNNTYNDIILNETVVDEENLVIDDKALLNWGETFSGIICSMGQVYGINSLLSSIIIYVAVMIYSPILGLMFMVGATIATFTSLIFAAAPFEPVYNGIWGYNGILSAGAVGGYFIVMTSHSFGTAIVNVIFTVLIQQALKAPLASVRLPVLTIPFVLSTLIFLSVSSSGNQLPKVNKFSVPETHRYEFLEKKRLGRDDKKQGEVDQTGEEKELVLEEVKVTKEQATRKLSSVTQV